MDQKTERFDVKVTISDGKVDVSPSSFRIKRGLKMRWYVEGLPETCNEVVINPVDSVFKDPASGKPGPGKKWCYIEATVVGFPPEHILDATHTTQYSISLEPPSMNLKWPPDLELVIDKCGPPPNP